jgi:hypothetical protein
MNTVPAAMTTDQLIEELKKYPGAIVKMVETDFRLVPVDSVEFVEYGLSSGQGYVWLKT